MLKTPFKTKSRRRRRHEARIRAEWLDRHGERIRLALIGGGIIFLGLIVAKMLVR